jgi:tRNA threonylcarbamoyl adenosine modification protein YeaZ
MKVLAFDTSGKPTAVSLATQTADGSLEILAERNFVDSENHSVSLMPTIDAMLREIGWKPNDLTRVAVAVGPGSYTGLRIAVTAAKTLAWTLGIELVGVSSLAVLAESVAFDGVKIPLMNARRGFVYAADGAKERYCALTDLLAQLKNTVPADKLAFVGETAGFEAVILENFPSAAILPAQPTGAALARLSVLAAPARDVHNFNPSYLKKVEAEEKWEAASGDSKAASDLVSRV